MVTTVLLIHGMGTHTDVSIKSEFCSGLNQCAKFLDIEDYEAENEFNFRFFNYSADWDEKRQQFSNYLEDDLIQLLGLAPSLVSDLFEAINEFDEDDFFYTHVLDVLFYLTSVLRAKAVGNLHQKLAEVMMEVINDIGTDHKLIVVAHSLGTAFIHDCLTQLYPNHLDPEHFALEQLWSVATVSRMTQLITGLDDPNHSVVTSHTPTSYNACKEFFAVFNEFDPFCVFKRYDREPYNGEVYRTTEVRNLQHIYGDDSEMFFNPHDLREYFADPKVGAKFLNNSGYGFTLAEVNEARTKHKATSVTGAITNAHEEIIDKLKELDNSDANSLTEKFVNILEALELIAKARKELEAGGVL